MICTISSRTSPLPPGNWWDAFRVTLAAEAGRATAADRSRLPTARARVRRFIAYLLQWCPPGPRSGRTGFHDPELFCTALFYGNRPRVKAPVASPHLASQHAGSRRGGEPGRAGPGAI